MSGGSLMWIHALSTTRPSAPCTVATLSSVECRVSARVVGITMAEGLVGAGGCGA